MKLLSNEELLCSTLLKENMELRGYLAKRCEDVLKCKECCTCKHCELYDNDCTGWEWGKPDPNNEEEFCVKWEWRGSIKPTPVQQKIFDLLKELNAEGKNDNKNSTIEKN